MYFWKTCALANDIKQNKISPCEWKNYLIGVTLFGNAIYYLSHILPPTTSMSLLYETIVSLIIFVWGIQKTFQTNRGATGFDYVARVIALAFPLMVKTLVFITLAFSALTYTLDMMSISHHSVDWLYTTLSLSVQAVIFIRIDHHLESINEY